jgi:hypothetical protein
VALVAGTKQTITGLCLFAVTRNMGTGSTPGRVITYIDRETLDAIDPDWHMATPNANVNFYTMDPRDPKTFYVFPPQPANTSQQVEIIQGIAPTPLSSLADNIPFDDTYEGALVDYVMYRAMQKDAESGNSERAMAHYQAFQNVLGVKVRTEATYSAAGKEAVAAQGEKS